MLRRDFLQAQMQKLAQVLARIIGLKKDGLPDEAQALLHHILKDEFGIEPADLQAPDPDQFLARIRAQAYGPEKTDLLSNFLYQAATPFRADDPECKAILQKVLALYDLLETDFRWQSLENLNRRTHIREFLAGGSV